MTVRPAVRRSLLRSLLLVLVLASSQVIGTPAAGACSCATTGDEGSFAAADAVFVGSLISRTVEGGLVRSSADPAVHRFEVRAVYKGEVRAEEEVVTAAEGASCGFEVPTDIAVLVFADEATSSGPEPGAGQLAGDLCNGTRPLDQRPVPDAFGTPVAPSQALVATAARADDEDGGPPVALAAVGGAALVATAAFVVRRRARPSGGRRRSGAA